MDEQAPLDLDARQDEVLQQLDALNQRIEAAIKEFAPPTPGAPESAVTQQAEVRDQAKAA